MSKAISYAGLGLFWLVFARGAVVVLSDTVRELSSVLQ